MNKNSEWEVREEILARDKTSIDIIWIKDKPLAYIGNTPIRISLQQHYRKPESGVG